MLKGGFCSLHTWAGGGFHTLHSSLGRAGGCSAFGGTALPASASQLCPHSLSFCRFFQEQQQDLFSLVAQDPKHKDLGFVMWAVKVEVPRHDKTGADDQHHSSL